MLTKQSFQVAGVDGCKAGWLVAIISSVKRGGQDDASWTAHQVVTGKATTLPQKPKLDSKGLRMEILCPAPIRGFQASANA